MILWYLANLVIALQIVNRIAPSSGFEINSTDFLEDVIQKLDEIKETNAENAATFRKELHEQSISIQKIKSEQERTENTASKQVDKLRSLLEEIKESNSENTAGFRRQLTELSATLQNPHEEQEASGDTSDEENLFLKELKEYLQPLVQQNLILSDAVQRIELKLSEIEQTLNLNVHSTRLQLESSGVNLGDQLLSAVQNGDVERVLLLLKIGAPIEYEDSKGNRPIHTAVQNSDPRMLEILLENNADIESHGENQMTALHLAGYNNCIECARILIAKGAQLESRDQWGSTPIIYPSRAGFKNFIELLLDNGAILRNHIEKYDTVEDFKGNGCL